MQRGEFTLMMCACNLFAHRVLDSQCAGRGDDAGGAYAHPAVSGAADSRRMRYMQSYCSVYIYMARMVERHRYSTHAFLVPTQPWTAEAFPGALARPR